MVDEPTNKDLMNFMAEMREESQAGFDNVEKRLESIEDRLQMVENKIDKALFGEIQRHERWIKKIAEKVGVELER